MGSPAPGTGHVLQPRGRAALCPDDRANAQMESRAEISPPPWVSQAPLASRTPAHRAGLSS